MTNEMNNERVVAIIPARGGSKRLPKKNILEFHGKPLLAWSLETAIECDFIDDVFLSSEDELILEVGRNYHDDIPLKRPASLSNDETTSNQVILHVIEKLNLSGDDVLIMMQPTSPLRSVNDLINARNTFYSNNALGVISVCECEHSPLWSNTLPKNLQLNGFIQEGNLVRSQDLEPYYRINGAIYMFRVSALKENGGVFYDQNVFASIMPRENSVDIDTELDFVIAKSIYSYQHS